MIPDDDRARLIRGRVLTFGSPLAGSAITIAAIFAAGFLDLKGQAVGAVLGGTFVLNAAFSTAGPLLGGLCYAGRGDGLSTRVVLAAVFAASGVVAYVLTVFIVIAMTVAIGDRLYRHL